MQIKTNTNHHTSTYLPSFFALVDNLRLNQYHSPPAEPNRICAALSFWSPATIATAPDPATTKTHVHSIAVITHLLCLHPCAHLALLRLTTQVNLETIPQSQ